MTGGSRLSRFAAENLDLYGKTVHNVNDWLILKEYFIDV